MAHEMKVAALLILLAAGCSGGGDPSLSTGSTASTAPPQASEVRVPQLPAGGDTRLVAAMGTLEVDGPCLYLRAPDGSRTLPLFAIDGVRWTSGTLVARNRTFGAGQNVTLGGTPLDAMPPNAPWVQAPDPRCSAPRYFIAHQID
ncbi:MAG TPA: hypothetical protein VF883_15760 [Thermoanaerobaculia bacterium]|jgi:hypothetical protein